MMQSLITKNLVTKGKKMTTEEIQMNVEQQNQLLQEINLLESKINSLQSHLDKLKTQPPTADVSSEGATTDEIIRQAQEAVKRQQEALARQTEAEAIERSLKIFRSQLTEKRDTLQISKRSSEFERLRHKAIEFNVLIDQALLRLDEMREIGREISFRDYTPFAMSAEIREMPYASIHDSIIRVRRRVDVKRES